MELQFQLLHYYCLTNVILFFLNGLVGLTWPGYKSAFVAGSWIDADVPTVPVPSPSARPKWQIPYRSKPRSRCSLPSQTLWDTGALCWDVLPGTQTGHQQPRSEDIRNSGRVLICTLVLNFAQDLFLNKGSWVLSD